MRRDSRQMPIPGAASDDPLQLLLSCASSQLQYGYSLGTECELDWRSSRRSGSAVRPWGRGVVSPALHVRLRDGGYVSAGDPLVPPQLQNPTVTREYWGCCHEGRAWRR